MDDGQLYYDQAIEADKNERGCEEAFDLFFKAARKKHIDAQYMLGVLTAESTANEQDNDKYEDAYDWWHKAARQGHIKSQYNLAICYSNGVGVEQDSTLAARWFEKSAEQDHLNAAFMLARQYYQGSGITRDFVKAYRWMEKAAKSGHVNAMADLALMCTMGQGIEKPDKIKGYAWALSADKNGLKDAKRIMKSIEDVFIITEADKSTSLLLLNT